MAKPNERLLLVCTDQDLLLLDHSYRVIRRKASDRSADYHGMTIYEGRAYVVETAQNAIGIYELDNLSRVGEIRLTPEKVDVNHVNDILVVGDKLYISLFTNIGQGQWRNCPSHSGVIIEYGLKENRLAGVFLNSLHKPHSIHYQHDALFFCNSAIGQVRNHNEVIYQTTKGFTRGLAISGPVLYVGQSISRNMEISNYRNSTCGIIFYDMESKTERFIQLPSEEVYGILLL